MNANTKIAVQRLENEITSFDKELKRIENIVKQSKSFGKDGVKKK